MEDLLFCNSITSSTNYQDLSESLDTFRVENNVERTLVSVVMVVVRCPVVRRVRKSYSKQSSGFTVDPLQHSQRITGIIVSEPSTKPGLTMCGKLYENSISEG